MGTLTSLMNIAQTALRANQAALNATANNVANQNTVGYTREIVNFQEQDSVTLGSTSYGQGVSIGSGPSSVRDRVLEQRVQQQTQVQAQSGALQTALTAVENIFGLSSTATSAAATPLGTAVDGFFNSFAALEANPSDAATRQAVLAAASSLANAFNATSSQIASVTSSLNGQVTDTVSQINSLTANIATLNQKIAAASPNGDAGVLEDQRQNAIAQLSQLVGLDQIATDQNGITLTTGSGAVLVSGNQSYALSTSMVSGTTHVLAGPDAVDVTATITGGSLGGILQARDQVLPSFASDLDTLAYDIGTQVNVQNASGLDGNGNPGGAIFTLPGSAAGAASSIALATNDPTSIAAAATGEGATGSGNAIALASLAGGAIVAGQTPSSFYASFLAQLGTATASATADNTIQTAALTQLTSQRDAISGVSLDEEAANLTQYQRSYEAAAKVFAIVNQLLSDALNLGVPTAVN